MQPTLFDAPSSIQDRFERFHRDHPEVFASLVRLARMWREKGRAKCGIRMLWERLRWEMLLEKGPDEEFTLNDHYHSRYVRLLCELHPELAGMFELRTLKAE